METTPFRAYQPGTQPPYDAPAYGSTHSRHPKEGLVRLPHTITETTGPRFSAAQFPRIADLSVVDGKASIKPGAYPWRNHHNAWRPNHIHFSFFGTGFAQRLVTQMYFPGDPLLDLDPVFLSVPDKAARDRLICKLDMTVTEPEWALGYRWDVVLRGRAATPFT